MRLRLLSSFRFRCGLWLALSLCAGPLAAKSNVPIAMSCSADAGRANLNELNDNNSGSFFDFVEIKVLRDNVDIAGWRLCVARDGGLQGCTDLGLGAGDWSDGSASGTDDQSVNGDTRFMASTWITYDASDLRPQSNKGEAILIDGDGAVLDHIAWDGDADCATQDHWSVPADCSVCLAGKDSSNKTLARMLPDGTGAWVDSNNAPTPAETNETAAASCDLGGFAVSQAANALACPSTPAAFTVTALCSDLATVKTDYLGTVALSSDRSGSLFYDTATGGSPIVAHSFSSGEAGEATLYLYHPDEAAVTVTVTDPAPDPDISASGSASQFSAFGFKVDPLASTLPACTVSATYALTAYGQVEGGSGCDVIEGFSGSKSLKIWSEYVDPDANPHATPVVLNGAVSLPIAESDSYAMTFVDGQAAFNLSYADAGRIKLHFKHDQDPYDGAPYGAMVAESSAIDLIPAGFGVTASGALGSLHGSGPGSAERAVAGAPFELRIQAQCADGTPTPNYRPLSADLTLTQAMPASGELRLEGSPLVPNGGSQDISALFVDGVIDDTAARYSEVGVVQATVEDSGYLGGSIPATTVAIGRFYPDHFRLSAPALRNRAELASCSDPFTYRGEPFRARFTLVAENQAGDTTENYDGAYAALASVDALNLGARAGGVDYSAALVVSGSPALVWAAGQGAMQVDLTLPRGSAPEAPVTGLTLGTAPTDGDGVTLDAFDLDLDGDGLDDHGTLGAVALRYGRAFVGNAFGPETEPLGQSLATQYYNGQGFVANGDDSCTVFDSAALVFTDAEGALLAASLATPSYDLPVSGGDAGLRYVSPADPTRGPGTGNTGAISLRLDLTGYPWLRDDWDGDGDPDDHDGAEDDPAGTATFGRYRGHDRVMFWREQFTQ